MESIDLLIGRYPKLIGCREDLLRALELLSQGFRRGGTLFTCGNGGSAADADHIVGELAKGFLKKRPVPAKLRAALAVYPDGEALADPFVTLTEGEHTLEVCLRYPDGREEYLAAEVFVN